MFGGMRPYLYLLTPSLLNRNIQAKRTICGHSTILQIFQMRSLNNADLNRLCNYRKNSFLVEVEVIAVKRTFYEPTQWH